ncbi:acyltransferase family protein [Paenibacillus illinoisensis]|uniref:acyltransferase family protein n=1 Tax=Paenibacillus illinoisensis TaxID=59845 RepID=UPI00203F1B6C|nr:acyltransferase family protein [Paenibacillus illinoisensis]MCM3205166.1 acyltransferase family protein [Paenibacillus illinoisensis]
MSKKISYEILLLRSLSCLSVAMVHAVMFTTWIHGQIDSSILNGLLMSMRLFFNAGTPIFVFITVFLLAKSYSDGFPDKFLWKRLKYLIPPYISMGIIGSFYKVSENGLPLTFFNLAIESLKNVFMADYNGYFIIIIIQFVLLFYFFRPQLNKIPLKIGLSMSFLINFAYLAFFNFIPPFGIANDTLAQYLWFNGSVLPFIGWIFYFFLGFYCGKHYDKFVVELHRYKLYVLIAPILITLTMIALKTVGIPSVNSSKAVTYLFLVPSLIFLIFFVSSKLKSVPSFIGVISDHSFGIYLTHSVLMRVFQEFYIPIAPSIHPLITLILIYITCVGAALLLSYVLNKIPFGKYIIGVARDNSKFVKAKKTPTSTVQQKAAH